MARLLRYQKQAQTRAGLLETAREVFIQRGYHRTTLAAVAEAAGFSKGAVYSNFKSKDDLFLAILDQLMDERVREVAADWAASAGAGDRARDFARRVARRRMRLGAHWSLLLMEFWTHAVREEKLRRAFAERHTRLVEAVGRELERAAIELGERLRGPASEWSRTASAVGHGLTLEWLLDPASVSEELLTDLLILTYEHATAPDVRETSLRAGRREGDR